jgi:hypothetical protein
MAKMEGKARNDEIYKDFGEKRKTKVEKLENQRKQRDKQHSINSQIMNTSRGK